MHKQLEAVTIYGDTIRTNNSRRQEYGHAWHKFGDENDVAANTVYALYFNYESDFRGDFDFMIGIAKDNGKPAYEIPAGEYYVWDVGTEDPMDVPDAWQEIWDSGMERAYITDFELYVPGESIKIYLAL